MCTRDADPGNSNLRYKRLITKCGHGQTSAGLWLDNKLEARRRHSCADETGCEAQVTPFYATSMHCGPLDVAPIWRFQGTMLRIVTAATFIAKTS